jgi:hypothetical protein
MYSRPSWARGRRAQMMASFSGTGAGKVHADHHLLTEILKGEWKYDGFVMSDWFGTYDPGVPAGGLDLEHARSRLRAAAERYNLLTSLERWVISTLVEHLYRQWKGGSIPHAPAPNGERGFYSVNLSGASINDITSDHTPVVPPLKNCKSPGPFAPS